MAREKLLINAGNKHRLPDHIALIEAKDINQACAAAVREMRREPVNAAVWNGWAENTPEALDSYVHLLRRKNLMPSFSAPELSSPEDIRPSVLKKFNEVAEPSRKYLKRHHSEECLAVLGDRIASMIMALASCSNSLVSLEMRNGRASPFGHEIHFDTFNLCNHGTGGILKPFFGQAVRGLLIVDGPGTALFGNESIKCFSKPTHVPHIDQYYIAENASKNGAEIWHTARWAVAILSGIYWPYQPIAHSEPAAEHWWQWNRRSLALATVKP